MDYQKIVALCLLCLLGCDVIIAKPTSRRTKRSANSAIVTADVPADDHLMGSLEEIAGMNLPSDDLEIGEKSVVLSRSRRSTSSYMLIALKQFCAKYKYACRRSHRHHRRRHRRRRRRRHHYRLHKER